ncbi:Membrane-bound lytic murein transglycosylase D [Fibrisoma limi BUZ 3]|uniref:Membrane-bound lytic murein transglycosylase D n=1 Tax=Fibrisoma limi BUZ 3 TaxID=1185876 RepID=I2GCU4_9BACT|nr:lytic transglycosylase domain-containing protein [Fibrisoma limi]CCH51718.1 Membrane-bound lytic murein transglycosylase D [Fibrisoma limi BUZ 3]
MTKLILIAAAGFSCGSFAVTSVNAKSPTYATALPLTTIAPTLFALHKPIEEKPVVRFCGESLPANQPDITARWARTLSRQAARAGSLAALKRRASVVFPIIEPIISRYDIPNDFKYLPLLESALTTRAVSRQGAAGFWQLMPQTAQSMGLSVARRRDERFNLLKATHAACRYLKQLYQQLGSWMLVAAAYNAGPNYVQQVRRQHPDQHPLALPLKGVTKAYLYQAVAVKELLTRPEAYRDYLSSRHLAALSDSLGEAITTDERSTILASLDMSAWTPTDSVETEWGIAIPDSTSGVELLTEADETDEAATTTDSVVVAPVADVAKAPSVPRLTTRSLSEGAITEGQLCVFQVVQPVTLNGYTFAVGDMIYAHVELLDATTGKAFLRTDKTVTADTQESRPLKLIAADQPRQPGVPIPSRLENWRLEWEQL